MLDELAEAQRFPHAGEVGLEGIVGVDGLLRVVGSVEVPGEEAGEVLDGSEDFVAADLDVARQLEASLSREKDQERTGRRDKAVEVAHGRVVDDGVGGHVGAGRVVGPLRFLLLQCKLARPPTMSSMRWSRGRGSKSRKKSDDETGLFPRLRGEGGRLASELGSGM